MTAISGKGGWVQKGAVTIADIKEWSMTGVDQPVVSDGGVFGATVQTKYVGNASDPGKVMFSGNYDPSDSTGQQAIDAICEAGTKITDLYLYANTSTFWRVGSGGSIIVTKCKAITLPRSGIGTINFEGEVSGATMEQVGVGT